MQAKSRSIARTRSISKVSTTNRFIPPIGCSRTMHTKTCSLRDVFDLARRECSCHRVAVCGASLGAYHAGNIAFRHPDLVSNFITLSGSFDIGSFFDGYHDDNIYFNSPYEYLQNTTNPLKYNHIGIILKTREWDVTRHESYRFSEILNSKGVKHWL